MQFFTALLGFVISISVIVVIHEGGHCLAAKWLGVRVERFSVGMGKVLLRRQWGETEYCLSLLPVGGYVKMEGETGGDDDDGNAPKREPSPRSYSAQPRWKRAIILLAGPLMNFVLAFMLYAGLGAAGIDDVVAVMDTPPAETRAAATGLQQGDRIVSFNGQPVHSMRAIQLELINAAGEKAVPFTYERNGREISDTVSLEGFTLEDITASKVTWWTVGFEPWRRNVTIRRIIPDTPASRSDLKPFDVVLAVDGVKPENAHSLFKLLQTSGKTYTLQVVNLKDVHNPSAVREVRVTPEETPEGQKIGVAVGDMPDTVTVRLGPVEAVQDSWHKVVTGTQLQARGVRDMATGKADTKQLTGPIGIADMAGLSVRLGAKVFLNFLAMLSLAIGFMNLIPLPVLDGGQLLILSLEGLRRKDFSEKTRSAITGVGLAAIGLLAVLVIFNDIARLV